MAALQACLTLFCTRIFAWKILKHKSTKVCPFSIMRENHFSLHYAIALASSNLSWIPETYSMTKFKIINRTATCAWVPVELILKSHQCRLALLDEILATVLLIAPSTSSYNVLRKKWHLGSIPRDFQGLCWRETLFPEYGWPNHKSSPVEPPAHAYRQTKSVKPGKVMRETIRDKSFLLEVKCYAMSWHCSGWLDYQSLNPQGNSPVQEDRHIVWQMKVLGTKERLLILDLADKSDANVLVTRGFIRIQWKLR